MKKITSILVLVVLLAAMAALQVKSARPVSAIPARGNVFQLYGSALGFELYGWPVGYRMAIVRLMATGAPQYEISNFYYRQAILDAAISLTLVFLAYTAITKGIIESQFRLTILKLFAATAGIGITISYFSWNHDMFLWNCRLLLAPSENQVAFRTLARPFWQNSIGAMFIFLSSSSVAHFLLDRTSRAVSVGLRRLPDSEAWAAESPE